MAAYASVVSLINLLDQVQQHQARRRQILFNDEQIQALRQRGEYLEDFLERYYSLGTSASNEEAEILEGQIVSAAVGVQDVIKSHMLHQVRAECTSQRDETSVDLCDREEMVAEMDSINTSGGPKKIPQLLIYSCKRLLVHLNGLKKKFEGMVVKIQDKATKAHSTSVANSNISRVPPSGKTAAIVGFDEEVIQIMEKLTGHPPRRVVFPILGIGGIGKTTLAKAVYENRLIVEYFDIRIWITVSQEFSTKEILLQAFSALNPQYKSKGSEREDKIGEKVYKTLCRRRYLIIMDDIWSVEAWEQVKRFFPRNNNGSRILVTTRQSDIGMYFGSGAFQMQLLGEDKSWVLFYTKAFGPQTCPPEMVAGVVAEMDSIKAMVVKFEDNKATKAHSSSVANSNTSRVLPSGKTAANAIVGLDEKVIDIMDTLTGYTSGRVVFPIVGMGGIGKTTLAKAVYENRLIVEYFDIRIWITVSQDFRMKEILLQAFLCINPQYNNITDGSESEDKIGENLYKTLFGRRYLIIMDDIWSVEAWEQIRRFFPENNNGSRVLVTSRQSDMGEYFGSGAYKMQFLEEDKSWKLFCGKAFGSQSCLPEFEEIGKKIVGKCRGLPLSLAVIGGLLAKSRTKEYWESVEKDMNSILSSENDEQCLNILSLSYGCLPVYLKPCFLHMGIFEEDYVVKVFRLIKVWVAEGFLKPKKDKIMEEVAMDYVRDLIDRNLILDNRDGTISIHDLLREVSLRIGQREKFFCVINMHINPHDEAYQFFKQKRGEEPWYFVVEESTSRTISLLCFKYYNSVPVNCESWMVRGQNIDYTTELFPYKLLSFPYLQFHWLSSVQLQRVLPLLYNFWNLQTLIITVDPDPEEEEEEVIFDIWKMPQIRHILFDKFHLPDPPVSCADESVLKNLQTLGVVQNFRCTEQVLTRIPNIKYLNFNWPIEDSCLKNVARFHKLETLICEHQGNRVPKRNVAFPTSLKHLSLSFFQLDWTDLKMIGELPDLEYLNLKDCNFEESELKIVEGGFRSLKYFLTGYYELTHWTVDSSQDFPKLERISLTFARKLSKIPDAIADIPTLNLIHLIDCPASVVLSALNILKEQLSQGNEDLQVKVSSTFSQDIANYGKMVASEELECCQNNFELSASWARPTYQQEWKWEIFDDIEQVWKLPYRSTRINA